jgi:hypothetical protein
MCIQNRARTWRSGSLEGPKSPLSHLETSSPARLCVPFLLCCVCLCAASVCANFRTDRNSNDACPPLPHQECDFETVNFGVGWKLWRPSKHHAQSPGSSSINRRRRRSRNREHHGRGWVPSSRLVYPGKSFLERVRDFWWSGIAC